MKAALAWLWDALTHPQHWPDWIRDWYGLRRHNSRKNLAHRLSRQQHQINAIFAVMREVGEISGYGDACKPLGAFPDEEGHYFEGLRDGARIALDVTGRKPGPPHSPERQRRIEESGLRVVKP